MSEDKVLRGKDLLLKELERLSIAYVNHLLRKTIVNTWK